MVNEKPYKQIKFGSWILRYFPNKNPEKLFWHRDKETRKVWKLFGDVCVQLDNELPQVLTKIIINKMTYHRAISNTSFLILIKQYK